MLRTGSINQLCVNADLIVNCSGVRKSQTNQYGHNRPSRLILITFTLCVYPVCSHKPNVNPYPANLIYSNFHPLEVVCRYRDPQLQVGENYSYLFRFRQQICKCCCLNTHLNPNKRFDLLMDQSKNDNSRDQHGKG